MTSVRQLSPKKRDRAESGNTECTCANCGVQFNRPYRMNATRKLKPQYCSAACLARARKIRAEMGLAERFWRKVYRGDGPDACWTWCAQTDKRGYGKFQIKHGQPSLAHRVSYMLAHGYMPPPECLVCHSCDNPKCVRPKHLWLGDDKANFDDMVAKGRHRPIPVKKGNEVWTSKLSEQQVREALSSPLSNKDIALKFGVSSTAIRLIRTGRNWAHLREAS